MNRLEQIIEASKTNIKEREDEILHVYDRHAGFIEGAIWADNTMIDKACEWLKDILDYCEIDCRDEENFLNDFKEAMEL